uniref:AP2/ERF domain-containing protein n=1 Tax=Chromera velia CCMP2878 TaxID=1169474 RepID=A0A0G4FBT5_9ALVE|eukprot:Cvel_16086.t1-p1 / transcript=Cvel_16086.t1 / gene=Cvel_16086 / organism=Chromera_velia_CCMP2878 / gene_product=hypothetical protein / transcript_product=hypothetical protein / location=Cvel_scaffold1223:17492-18705(+) / protein_length=275 / sequence_SO=supercontig / SO=protein_coding / is_pseudo=false
MRTRGKARAAEAASKKVLRKDHLIASVQNPADPDSDLMEEMPDMPAEDIHSSSTHPSGSSDTCLGASAASGLSLQSHTDDALMYAPQHHAAPNPNTVSLSDDALAGGEDEDEPFEPPFYNEELAGLEEVPIRGVYYLDRLRVWRVECCIDGRRAMKNFSVSKWGFETARQRAISWRIEKARSKGTLRQSFAKAEHQSGVKGVNWCTFRKAWVAVARRGGKRTQKYFFAATHGFHEALELAKQFRQEIDYSKLVESSAAHAQAESASPSSASSSSS